MFAAMNFDDKKTVRIAILDLYEGAENQGMRCIREIIKGWQHIGNYAVIKDEFEVRLKNEVPDTSYDLYISSGGPGSPLDTVETEWEIKYFQWLRSIEDWNNNDSNYNKKFAFFICHSFQLVARYYQIGTVRKRKSTAFGIFPVHMLEDGKNEPLFTGLKDPFYAMDSRDYQLVEPDYDQLSALNASILAIEKERPHVPYERAVMAVRFNEYFLGTQFHPEADAAGMSMYLQRHDKKKMVIDNYGEPKWKSMIDRLDDPDKIMWTYSHILPNFLNLAMSVNASAMPV